MTSLPPRLWIVGPCGSGKSSVADVLAARLGVEATHLDDLHWAPGWVERSREDLIERLAPIVAKDTWVIDGNYSYTRERYGDRASLFVWLDLPFTTSFPRLLRRSVARSFSGAPCCNGNRETLGRTFFHRESILWWAIRTHRARGRYSDIATRPHVLLRAPRDVAAFLADAGIDTARAEWPGP